MSFPHLGLGTFLTTIDEVHRMLGGEVSCYQAEKATARFVAVQDEHGSRGWQAIEKVDKILGRNGRSCAE
ncbi:MAG: hypothetical protein ACR2FX_09195 [Chthoniobacterales bacterium]